MFSKGIKSTKLITFIFLVFLCEYILMYLKYKFKLDSETIVILVSFTPGFALSMISLKHENTRFNSYLFIFMLWYIQYFL